MATDYEDFSLKSSDKTSVWHYFLRAKDKSTAKCKQCNKLLKTSGGSTGGLLKHIKNIHNIHLECGKRTHDEQEASSSKSADDVPTKKTKISDYFHRNTTKITMEEMVSRMVALDGLTFRVFTTSDTLRQLFEKSGHTLPKSPNSIREIILNECNMKKKQMIKEIAELKAENRKFSISLDEWTSRKRRYLNINIHSPNFSGVFKFRNLGLIRAYGSMPAEKCLEAINNKLSELGISLDTDIISLTTDGAKVMTKLGRLCIGHHQQCLAHAIQLAIVDVLYKKNEIEEDEVNIEGSDNDIDSETEEEPDNEEDGADFTYVPNTRTARLFRYYDLISKVRSVVKMFCYSPTKNDILQNYVSAEFGREYSLILDVKTRWTSMADMIERFLKLKDCVMKALIDVKSNIDFDSNETNLLTELSKILEIIKTIVQALCRRDATLLTAEVAVKFAIKNLQDLNISLATKMAHALQCRYTERRLIETATLQYLHNPDIYFSNLEHEDTSIFTRPNSERMCQQMLALLQRLNNIPTNSVTNIEAASTSSAHIEIRHDDDGPTNSKKDELERELRKLKNIAEVKRTTSEDIGMTLKIEMALFENGGDRGRYLSFAYDYLISMPPTSVEAERVFSSAGYICNRIRSALGDKSIDAISFLRSFYTEQNAVSPK